MLASYVHTVGRWFKRLSPGVFPNLSRTTGPKRQLLLLGVTKINTKVERRIFKGNTKLPQSYCSFVNMKTKLYLEEQRNNSWRQSVSQPDANFPLSRNSTVVKNIVWYITRYCIWYKDSVQSLVPVAKKTETTACNVRLANRPIIAYFFRWKQS